MLRQRPAFTVPELITTLVLLGILFGTAVPAFRHAIDVVSVRAARDTIVGAAARARALAVARGDAQLVVDEAAGIVAMAINRGAQRISETDLGDRYGVTMRIANSTRPIAVVDYDGLGIGRFANLTVQLQRRSASGGVTFSAYGRPRAW
ncbi:MAG TPA: hypothetical protein VK864_06325 [Longimicrobiales bacterium]|nr:hypothetical protein [Longimicrobiales bacterium]